MNLDLGTQWALIGLAVLLVCAVCGSLNARITRRKARR